jgi:hypothetical protein
MGEKAELTVANSVVTWLPQGTEENYKESQNIQLSNRGYPEYKEEALIITMMMVCIYLRLFIIEVSKQRNFLA